MIKIKSEKLFKIAVILACHNRRIKTISCLDHLFALGHVKSGEIQLEVYLTDDGSTDETGVAVKRKFPEENINVLIGDGTLFWAGGMRLAWLTALDSEFDGYLLINDDTRVTDNLFTEILYTHEYCLMHYKLGGIYIGSTRSDMNSNVITYGGSNLINLWSLRTKKVEPNNKNPQICDMGNGNIMYVPKSVVKTQGILDSRFTHMAADYDYTYKARKAGIPVLVMPSVCGYCENDHSYYRDRFVNLSFRKRIEYTYSPKGLALRDYLRFNSRNFFFRVPFVFCVAWSRIFFPALIK